MAAPVQLIFTDDPGTLPATYTLPPSLDLDLATIRAKINGAGASGSFLPCLSIFSQDGKLMARVPLDTTYAVGDTGEGTWAPFLRTAATSTPPPPSGSVVGYAVWSVDNFAIGVGATDVVFASIDTSFDSAGHFSLTAGGDLQVNGGGIYALSVAFNNFTFAANVDAQLEIDVERVSGSVGTWSNRPGVNELTGDLIYNIVSGNASAVQGQGDKVFGAFIGWNTGDTFPAVIRVTATWLINEVETAATPDIRAAMVRFGDGDQ